MNKEKFRIEAHKAIENVVQKLESLERKKDTVNSELKAKINNQISDLTKKKKELEKKFNELKSATDENWNELKDSYNKSLAHFKAGLSEMEKIVK